MAQFGAAENSESFIIGMSNSSLTQTISNFSYSWVLDSGATSHTTCSLSCFQSYHSVKEKYALLPNQFKVPVQAVGIVCFNSELVLTNLL